MVCAAIGGFLFGYDTAIVNAALFQLSEHFGFELDSWQSGAVVGLGVFGAFIGSAVAGILADVKGRRFSIVLADVAFLVGSLIAAASPWLWLVFVGRLVLGFGIGAASVVTPVYLAEMSPADSRGMIVTLNNLFITGAQFLASGIGAMFVLWTSHDIGWRFMFALGGVPALVQVALLASLLPETPRFLLRRGRHDEARRIMEKFVLDPLDVGFVEAADSRTLTGEQQDEGEGEGGSRITPNTDDHLYLSTPGNASNVKGTSAGEEDGFSFAALLAPSMRRRLLIGGGLQAFQQLAGINTIMYYSASILKDAGIEGKTMPVVLSVPLAFTNALFTVVGMRTVDSLGRRKTLLVSLIGCFVALAAVTGVSFAHEDMTAKDRAISFMCLLFLYLVFFAPGMGPIPWVMNSEIYPTNLRTAAAGAAAMMNWLFNALMSFAFPPLMGSIGMGWTFSIVTVFVCLSIAFVFLFVPETKGKTLEEIEKDL